MSARFFHPAIDMADDHPVATQIFGAIERIVSPFNQAFSVLFRLQFGNTEAGSNFNSGL